MRVAVLAPSTSWYFRDLRRAARSKHEVISVSFNQLESALNLQTFPLDAPHDSRHNTRNEFRAQEMDLLNFDAILVRSMPPGTLEQIVFRMDVLAQLEAAGVTVVNPPKAMEAAIDKYLTTAKLLAAGLPVPPTIACQTYEGAMAAFETLGKDVVVKPLFGGEGRGLVRITDEAIAHRTFKTLQMLGVVFYVQQYLPHKGYDLRLLVIGNEILAVRRSNSNDWRTNLNRGGVARPFSPDDELIEQARRASAAVGARLAGVDILPALDDRRYFLEVNATPGWKHLAAALNIDVAAMVWRLVESKF